MKKFLFLLVVCLFSLSLHAQSPRTISYQGMIHGARSGNHSVTLTLYSDASGTQKLWQATTNTMLDSSGIFNTVLGSAGNPLPDASAMDRLLWLGVSIDDAPELRPLSQLAASPYSLNVADSSITAQKLNANYVSSISVDGQPITGKGTNVNIVSGPGLNATWIPTSSSLLLSGTGRADTGNKVDFIATNPCGTNSDGSVTTNTVSGGCGNLATASAGYATIGGGDTNQATGTYATVGGGQSNNAYGADATIAGGGGNLADAAGTIGGGGPNKAAEYGTVAGGVYDSAGYLASVGGGQYNLAQFGGTIGGGSLNLANMVATVGGGATNRAYGLYSTIAGGTQSYAESRIGMNDSAQTVGGGYDNVAQGDFATVGGGEFNQAGTLSAIPGGFQLEISDNSFGFNGKSLNPVGAFVSANNVAYFGNVDLEIASNDTIARQLRLFVPNSNTIYTSFEEPAITCGIPVHYVLPGCQATAMGQVLTNDGTGNLSWGPGPGNAEWLTTGNYATHPPFNFLGTLDSNSLELHLFDTGSSRYGNERVMGYYINDTSANIIGGFHGNGIVPLDTSLHSHIVGVVIAGGGASSNVNSVKGSYAVISGGRNNMDTVFATIGGGDQNRAMGAFSVVGGGSSNTASSSFSMVGGGSGNHATGMDATVSGGSNNNAIGIAAVVAGGNGNTASEDSSAIGGGGGNTASGVNATIAGGLGNRDTTLAFVGGGDSNTASGISSVIVGGFKNKNQAPYGSIVGGTNNSILLTDSTRFSNGAFIGGGTSNRIQGDTIQPHSADNAAIVAGSHNLVTDSEAFIGAGTHDTVQEQDAAILAGANDRIFPGAFNAVILAGELNAIQGGGRAFVGTGLSNVIGPQANDAAIVAGSHSTITQLGSFVGAGDSNSVHTQFAAVVAGVGNSVDTTAFNAFIAAGSDNTVNGPEAMIGAGQNDTANANESFVGAGQNNITKMVGSAGNFASIPAGEGLVTQSYAQTAMGFFNILQGSTINDSLARTGTLIDDPLVIVGNGKRDLIGPPPFFPHTVRRSDAFTIANAGYSTAYDNIGSGSIIATHMGSTYENNTIIAWANVAAGGNVLGDIGVSSIYYDTTNKYYVIQLNVAAAGNIGTHFFNPNDFAVVATIVGSGLSGIPGIIEAGGISATGIFTISTWTLAGGAPKNTFGFMFHVVAK